MPILVLIGVLTGCGINPVRLQPPDIGGPAKHRVVIEFASALNLPTGAKVDFEGATVGAVRDVALDDGQVAVSTSIDAGTLIPGNSQAAIVQDTVLGDSYIRLTGPLGPLAAPPLTDGSVIPVGHTLPPTSIEDMMTTLSTFLGTGSLQQMQGALRRINAALPDSDAGTRTVAATLSADLRSVADDGTGLEASLANLHQLSSVLSDRSAYLQDLVSDDGQRYWTNITSAIGYIGTVLPSVGSIFVQGYWLIPLLDSVSGALEQAGAASGGDHVELGWQIDNFAGETLLPFLSNPRIDVTQVTTPDGADKTADTSQVLRNLGAVP